VATIRNLSAESPELSIPAIRKRLAGCRADLDRIGVAALSVFGSVARNEASAASDIDFLVDFTGSATLDKYMDLQILLESRFGPRVDLVTRKSLRPQIRAVIESEAIRVA
jgi:uncharacterized protein